MSNNTLGVLPLSQEEAGAIFAACFPHILAVTHWARTVQAKTHLGMPSLTYNTAVQQAARCAGLCVAASSASCTAAASLHQSTAVCSVSTRHLAALRWTAWSACIRNKGASNTLLQGDPRRSASVQAIVHPAAACSTRWHGVHRPLRFLLCIWCRLCKLVADYANLGREERKGKKYFDPKQRLPPPDALAFDAACIAARASDIARWLVDAELQASYPSKARPDASVHSIANPF